MMLALIIDDSPTMRKIVKDSLIKMGNFTTIEAENCADGLRQLVQTSVDLILVDWNMPGMTGIDFVKAIRSKAALAKLPIVMITSNAQKQQVLSAVMAGVNGYIVKPFTPEVFVERINKALGL